MLDEREKGLVLGADHYMSKPVDRDRLRDILSSYAAAPAGVHTALVVDDSEPTRQLFRRALERAGWSVVEAEHGEAALECSTRTILRSSSSI
jgi:hypothetical protein